MSPRPFAFRLTWADERFPDAAPERLGNNAFRMVETFNRMRDAGLAATLWALNAAGAWEAQMTTQGGV